MGEVEDQNVVVVVVQEEVALRLGLEPEVVGIPGASARNRAPRWSGARCPPRSRCPRRKGSWAALGCGVCKRPPASETSTVVGRWRASRCGWCGGGTGCGRRKSCGQPAAAVERGLRGHPACARAGAALGATPWGHGAARRDRSPAARHDMRPWAISSLEPGPKFCIWTKFRPADIAWRGGPRYAAPRPPGPIS